MVQILQYFNKALKNLGGVGKEVAELASTKRGEREGGRKRMYVKIRFVLSRNQVMLAVRCFSFLSAASLT